MINFSALSGKEKFSLLFFTFTIILLIGTLIYVGYYFANVKECKCLITDVIGEHKQLITTTGDSCMVICDIYNGSVMSDEEWNNTIKDFDTLRGLIIE